MTDKAVIQRMQELEDANGGLDPRAVVDDARRPESPLHPLFDWDDSEAAEKWRLHQARHHIRQVRLVIHETQVAVRKVVYVRDPGKPAGEAGYVSTARLREQPERSRAALLSELERAEQCLTRAYDVAFTLGLSSEIEALRARLRAVKGAA